MTFAGEKTATLGTADTWATQQATFQTEHTETLLPRNVVGQTTVEHSGADVIKPSAFVKGSFTLGDNRCKV
jgi:hypothetical protein